MAMTEEQIIDDYWTFRDLLRSVRISAPYVSPELTARISAALDDEKHQINEAMAVEALSEFLRGPSGMDGYSAAKIVQKRREVVMILQGIERPEPITEAEAAEQLPRAGVLPAEAPVLVEAPLRQQVIAILQAVQP